MMDIHTSGIARIRHRETGEIFEIEADELDWDAVGSDDRQMGPETVYAAAVEHPDLGYLSWTLWEYPMGAENDRETDVGGHELLENLRFSLEHLPEYEEPLTQPVSLAARLAHLPDQLDAIEEAIRALRSEKPMLGHNQPPEEYRLGLDEIDLDRADRDVAVVREELAKADAIDTAAPERLAEAQSGLRRLAAKLWSLIKWGSKHLAAGAVAAIGKELWEDPVALHQKVVSILDTIGAWLHHLIG
jgi:hypothetical protein